MRGPLTASEKPNSLLHCGGERVNYLPVPMVEQIGKPEKLDQASCRPAVMARDAVIPSSWRNGSCRHISGWRQLSLRAPIGRLNKQQLPVEIASAPPPECSQALPRYFITLFSRHDIVHRGGRKVRTWRDLCHAIIRTISGCIARGDSGTAPISMRHVRDT